MIRFGYHYYTIIVVDYQKSTAKTQKQTKSQGFIKRNEMKSRSFFSYIIIFMQVILSR